MGLPLNDMGRHPVLHDSATLMLAVVASIELGSLAPQRQHAHAVGFRSSTYYSSRTQVSGQSRSQITIPA